MFFLYITLSYILLNIYVFIRIRNLFISKGYRGLYLLVYLLLIVIYPLVGRAGNGQANFLIKGLSSFSNNFLTFSLYLFGISPDLPVILLDHRPTELQEVSRTAVDVQFSGHTHNGQLFPLNFIIRSMYELS